MANSEEEVEEEDNEWRSSFEDSAPGGSAAVPGQALTRSPGSNSAHRVIVHFDLDCFYAQVEMIRNPALRHVPLGIQQKYIIVTCNYVAREQGLTKLMSVTDAKEKCPQLVLVNGEDLTHYREISYKVTELLMSYSPLVERLGFDENFMDVTEIVEKRLSETPELENLCFKGHVYNHYSTDLKACHNPRLAVGSHIAAEIREALHSRLGLTGCAGIAMNKLLAKLVSGTFKPNQQTTLLLENVSDIMSGLSSLRKVPGVGHQTGKRLQALGLVSIKDLQLFPLTDLVREFGAPSAERLKNLVMGIDESPVTLTGAPQSLSDEDSFKKMSSTKDVLEKVQQLLTSLVGRMNKDGRQPQTFRLTIRRYSATNKWFSRESRQCPIPNHIGQKITSGYCEDAVALLVPLAMKLFHKMVDNNTAFHLTLINVCFSNLQTKGTAVKGRGSITSFFRQGTSPGKTQTHSSQTQNDSSPSGDRQRTDGPFNLHKIITQHSPQKPTIVKGICTSEAVLHGFGKKQSYVVAVDPLLQAVCSTTRSDPDEVSHSVTYRLPPNVDLEVFKLLPEDIQKELLSPAYVNALPSTSACVSAPSAASALHRLIDSQNTADVKEAGNESDPPYKETTVNHHSPLATSTFKEEIVAEGGRKSLPRSPDCKFPRNVDPEVFSELPSDVQRELMSEWKQQKTVLKAPSSRKAGKLLKTKDTKAAAKGSQSNSLFNYFKPA